MRIDVLALKSRMSGKWRGCHSELAHHIVFIIERGRKHGPCICGGKDRARCHNDYEQTGGIFCNVCKGNSDGIGVLMWANGWDFRTALEAVANYLGDDIIPESYPSVKSRKSVASKDYQWHRENLREIWEQSATDTGRVSDYFSFRGLSGTVPETIRFHPDLYFYENGKVAGAYPAMVAQFTRDDCTVGLHLTYLSKTEPGRAKVKDNKKTRKSCETLIGASVRLYALENDKPLVICEGLETGIALFEGYQFPVWVAGNASLLRKIEIPKSVSEVYIAGDKDKSLAGKKAAEFLANRLVAQNFKVKVSFPPGEIPKGQKSLDWRDVLARKGVPSD